MKNVTRYVLMRAILGAMTLPILSDYAYAASGYHRHDDASRYKPSPFFRNAAMQLSQAILFRNNSSVDDISMSPQEREAALLFKNYMNSGDITLLRSSALGNESVAWLYLQEVDKEIEPRLCTINDDEVTYAFSDEDDAHTLQKLEENDIFSPYVKGVKSNLAVQAYRLSNDSSLLQEKGISPQGANFLREKALHNLREMAQKGSKEASERYSSVILEEIEQAKIVLSQGKRLLDLSSEKIDQLAEAEFNTTGQREQINAIKAQRDVFLMIQEELNKNIHMVVAEAPEIKEFQRYLLGFFSNPSRQEIGGDGDLKEKFLNALAQRYECTIETIFQMLQKHYDPELITATQFFQQLNDTSTPVTERLSKILSDLPDEKSSQVVIYKNIASLFFLRSHDAVLGFADQVRHPSKAQERFDVMMEYLKKVKQLDEGEGKRLFTYYFSRITQALIMHHDLIEAMSKVNPTPFDSLMYYDATIGEDGAISFHGHSICERGGDPFFWAKGEKDTRVLMAPSFKNPYAPWIDLLNFGDSVKDHSHNIARMIEFALYGDSFSQEWLINYMDKFKYAETPLDGLDIFSGLTPQKKLQLCFEMMKRD